MSDSFPAPQAPKKIRLHDLFFTFAAIAFQSFGGATAIAMHYIIDVKKWMSEKEFLEVLTVCQALPGPNIMNLSLVLGDRYAGLKGAIVSVAGMFLFPAVLSLLVFMVYSEFSDLPIVKSAFIGMGASAAGLVIGAALKLATDLFTNPIGKTAWLSALGITFGLIALCRISMVIVLPIVGIPYVLWAAKVLSSKNPPAEEK